MCTAKAGKNSEHVSEKQLRAWGEEAALRGVQQEGEQQRYQQLANPRLGVMEEGAPRPPQTPPLFCSPSTAFAWLGSTFITGVKH